MSANSQQESGQADPMICRGWERIHLEDAKRMRRLSRILGHKLPPLPRPPAPPPPRAVVQPPPPPEPPREEEPPPMSQAPEARHCPLCSKKLRSSNNRGICTPCWKEGKRPEGFTPPTSRQRAKLLTSKPARARPPKAAGLDVAERFRIVAEALGQDPGALALRLMQSWLDELKASAGGDE